MINFKIEFAYPWLLLLLIPAVALALIPYFRLGRKYRRTRNRIVSLVLHIIVMTCSITVLSGITFSYDIPNIENELILLVDASDSDIKADDAKNNFIKSVIDENASRYKVGIVTFGWSQVYAAELSTDPVSVYNKYKNSEKPDTTATDIASALRFAREKLEHPATSKIVLLSDGKQTDGNANTVIRSIAADGVKVDTVYFPTERENEVQITGVTLPEYNIRVGEEFTIKLSIQSDIQDTEEKRAFLTLTDNGEEVKIGGGFIDVVRGKQVVDIQYTFNKKGMHKLGFSLSMQKENHDAETKNNDYGSYVLIEAFDKILLVEKYDNESQKLKELLSATKDEDGEPLYNTESVKIDDTEKMPATLDALRDYDQVILVNIANADFPVGFDKILRSYVEDVGGGLLTVGGNRLDLSGNPTYDYNGNIIPNAYNRSDMNAATHYKEMLPVQAINFTPPLGLMIIIDRSGSMGSADNMNSPLSQAKEGARTCLDILSERDWVGVMTLESDYSEEAEIQPATQRPIIESKIASIVMGGGTVFTGAIEAAGRALASLKEVEKRHIILITDGDPADSFDQYSSRIERNFNEFGITFSVVTINGSHKEDMEKAAAKGGGKHYLVDRPADITGTLRDELTAPEIKEVEYKTFVPSVTMPGSPLMHGITELPALDGYYGTKAKKGADVILNGEYVPIYAQWKFGEGMVGSFMCDLNGIWSSKFMAGEGGITFINNVVNSLFPSENIRSSDIGVRIREDNYTNMMSIFTELKENESIRVTVESPLVGDGDNDLKKLTPNADEGFSRLTFYVTKPGLHKVTVEKLGLNEEVVSTYSTYKVFSYSKEYDMFIDEEQCKVFMTELAGFGRGSAVESNSPWDVFKDFSEYLHRVVDPRLPLIIIALVLLLIDIAVRKFKFKWPHELIFEYREKRREKEKHGGQ